MFGVALGNHRFDAAGSELATITFCVVTSITLDPEWFLARPTNLSSDRRYGIHQRDQLGDIVDVRRSENASERNALRIGDDVMLTPSFPPIRRARARFFPPYTARMEELSTIANVMPCPPMPFVPEEYHGQLVVFGMLCYAGPPDRGPRPPLPRTR